MTTLATAQAHSTAAPAAFFARWADMATWPEWNTDTEWVRLDGAFVTGASGVLKPKGGPKVRFVVGSMIPEREFVDVSLLFGAKLTFSHLVRTDAEGTTIDVTVSMTGPMAWFWRFALGKGLRSSLQPDLDRLVAAAEADVRAANGVQ
jgi:hypothetical protein